MATRTTSPTQEEHIILALEAGATIDAASLLAGTSHTRTFNLAEERGVWSIARTQRLATLAEDVVRSQTLNRSLLGEGADLAQWAEARSAIEPLLRELREMFTSSQWYVSVNHSSKSKSSLTNEPAEARAARIAGERIAEAVATLPKPKSWPEVERLARVRASITGPSRQPIVAGGGRETPVVALVALPSPAARATEGVVLDVYATESADAGGEEP